MVFRKKGGVNARLFARVAAPPKLVRVKCEGQAGCGRNEMAKKPLILLVELTRIERATS